MTLNELLGSVVDQLQTQEQDINSADPSHPTHGSDMLAKFQAAQNAASRDPNADLGSVFAQVAQAIGGHSDGFTSQAYSSGFGQAASAFQGRPNQLSASDLGPIIGALTQGFGQHDTRGVNTAGPMAVLGPILGALTGNQGGINPIQIAGALLGGGGGLGGLLGALAGGGQNPGGLGSILGGVLGASPAPQQGGLGGILGGVLGGAQQQDAGLGGILGGLLGGNGAATPAANGGSDVLGQILGSVQQHANQPNTNGYRDPGAASTGAVLNGILGALLK